MRSSSFHFHFKRCKGVTWPLCAELVDQNWVHFNETFHYNWDSLHEKAGHQQSPIWVMWSERVQANCSRVLNFHHSSWTTCAALWKCQYPYRGSTGWLLSGQLLSLLAQYPSHWQMVLTCPVVFIISQTWVLFLPASGWAFYPACVICSVCPARLTGTTNGWFRGLSKTQEDPSKG